MQPEHSLQQRNSNSAVQNNGRSIVGHFPKTLNVTGFTERKLIAYVKGA